MKYEVGQKVRLRGGFPKIHTIIGTQIIGDKIFYNLDNGMNVKEGSLVKSPYNYNTYQYKLRCKEKYKQKNEDK